ncbi:sigma-70 family RNA polymerase sigma factor [Thomasclavelia cocleata]|jgi:RNA polymerase sigma factor (sigma-70 family)|uniref:sigma-70 family RNA polymerase sigma factor n=1 Tax=Thomasclavelia cocleata TaxID=69824 RepID=UPI00241E3C9C|nr:sigma-70 family RNA polymerase sigma factor [Thomasclavelia cocleata]
MKNDYQKNYFWICPDEFGNKKYYFNIKGNLVEVSKEVFNVCYNSYKKQLRDQKKDINANLISLDDVNKDGMEISNFVGVDPDYISDMYMENQIALVMKCISELNNKDRDLITNLLIKEKTEREIAQFLNTSQPSIHKRKKAILRKIRKNIKK